MALTVAAVVAVLALLAYLVWLRRDVRSHDALAEPPEDERRAENALFMRLLENLSTLDERYRTFTYRVLRAVALIGVGCAIALALGGRLLDDTNDLADDTHRLAEQQRDGRAVAIDALCGAISGVVEAGRATITAGTGKDDKETAFTRALVRLGYPPISVRRTQANDAAKAYGKAIAKAVEDATKQKHLTRKDGSLDCSRVKRVAGA